MPVLFMVWPTDFLFFMLGACYLDFPANLLTARAERGSLAAGPLCPPPPQPWPSIDLIKQAVEVIKKSSRPLVIVGKGEL